MCEVPKPLVVVAEDTETTRRLIEVTLKNCGCDVVAVSNGEDALEKILALRPAIAILDVQMPRLTGLEVGKELQAHAQNTDTAIIFLTSRTQEHDVLEGFLSGGTDYLFKPFSPRELQARVKTLLLKRATNV